MQECSWTYQGFVQTGPIHVDVEVTVHNAIQEIWPEVKMKAISAEDSKTGTFSSPWRKAVIATFVMSRVSAQHGPANNMPQTRAQVRALKRQPQTDMATPNPKQGKTKRPECQIGSCLKGARRKGANNIVKKVRIDKPVKATVAYWIFIYRIKRGMQSYLEKLSGRSEVESGTEGIIKHVRRNQKKEPRTRFTLFQGHDRAIKPFKILHLVIRAGQGKEPPKASLKSWLSELTFISHDLLCPLSTRLKRVQWKNQACQKLHDLRYVHKFIALMIVVYSQEKIRGKEEVSRLQ
ncbi:hypothetical protein PoB_001117800 [Plakobranchus ocellatus]|uniref:Uncharacterized protein n=1 Tax=Plakobranchus ocellatus TaxID=259542 RepID=A0AAV3YQP5_9GAST|nr:hypothetical protein PoB_001117800 [Plakobranchus ocellatus]